MKLLAYTFLLLCIVPNHIFSMLGNENGRIKKSSSQLMNGSKETLPTDFLTNISELLGDDAKQFLDRKVSLPKTATIREYLPYQERKDSYENKTQPEHSNIVDAYVINSLLEDDQFCECMFTKLLLHKNNSTYADVQIFFENKILEKIRNDTVNLKWYWFDCFRSGCLGLNCCVITGVGIRLLLKNYPKLGYSALILGALGTLIALPTITEANAEIFFANNRIQTHTNWIEMLKNNGESQTVVYQITN